jgi:outer membrane protein assembly factor BamB
MDSIAAFMGGSDRHVVAVDLATGRTRWSHRLAGPLVGGVLRAGQVVYAATDRPGGRVHALQTISGNELWSTPTGYVEAPLALAGDRLIVLNRVGEILAVDTAGGRVLWRRHLPSQRVGPLLLRNGLVLVSSFDSLYLVQPQDGRVVRRRRSPGTVVSGWLNDDGTLITGTGDSLVVGLDPDSLTVRWEARLDGPLLTAPAIRGDTVYCVTQLGALYRVLGDTVPEVTRLSDTRWAATGALALFGPWALVGGAEGRLRAFRLDSGIEAWTAQLGRPLELAPLVLGDSGLLALGGRGDLHRMRL